MRHVLASSALLAMCACTYDLTNWALCDLDPESCGSGASDWPTATDCQRNDDLQIEVGTGAVDYEPLATGQAFVLHSASGGGQGSDVRHIDLGLRVRNPDPVHRKYKVKAAATQALSWKTPPWMRDQKDCGTVAAPDIGSVTNEHEAQCEVISDNTFVVEKSLKPGAEGSIQRGGLRVFVGTQPKRVTLTVIDDCGRKGKAEHAVNP